MSGARFSLLRNPSVPLPQRGRWGLLLIAFFWPINWLKVHPVNEVAFFFLWLGYILVVDALVEVRRGSSLWSRSRWLFLSLFIASAPVWWLFEFFNRYLQNWHYIGGDNWPFLKYYLIATLDFSTVIPAILTTAELMASFDFIRNRGPGPSIRFTRQRALLLSVGGALMALSVILWPRYTFPLVWLSIFFLLDPINDLRHRPSLIRYIAQSEWRPIIALWLAGLMCGFFWEMWNFYALPKWIYTVPFVGFLHVFEMPILGYGGYLPFAMEVFALYYFLGGMVGIVPRDYVRLLAADSNPHQ